MEDRYVSRARPTGVYVAYLVCSGFALALILGVKIDPTAMLILIGPLIGGSAFYSHNRTKEKREDKQ